MTAMGGYDDPFNDRYDKGRMEKIPAKDDLLTYAGGDTDAAHQVADVLRDELSADDQLTRFYVRILHPAARAFEKIERRGVLVDRQKYAVLGDDLRKVIASSQDRAMSLLPNKMRLKFRDRIDDQIAAGKSPLLPSILKEFFFTPHGLNLKPKERTEKTQEPSMAKSHLRQFADVPEAAEMVAALTEMDSASKTLSTFVEGFLNHLRPDGRLHPQYFLGRAEFEGQSDEFGHGDRTPVGQRPGVPDAAEEDQVGEAHPRMLHRAGGQGGAELRLQPGRAQGGGLRGAGEDHALGLRQRPRPARGDRRQAGAGDLCPVPVVEGQRRQGAGELFDKNRTNAKPANFGLFYGMGVEGFQAYAWANYGIKLTEAEAAAMRNAFFELYPGLTGYHDRQREIVRFSEMVRSPLGRLRHLPMIKAWDRQIKSKAERQAINSPIQSCLSDMMLWAIALIDDAYPNGEIEVVGMIHDALIAYIPAHDVDLWAGRAINIMANLPFSEVGWKPQLKFTADAEAGPNLAEIKKLKFAA